MRGVATWVLEVVGVVASELGCWSENGTIMSEPIWVRVLEGLGNTRGFPARERGKGRSEGG